MTFRVAEHSKGKRVPKRLQTLKPLWLATLVGMTACASPDDGASPPGSVGRPDIPTPIPEEPPNVRTYVARRTASPPRIDGRLDTVEWGDAIWTEPFQDIEGERVPPPPLDTRVLMAWDDEHLYIGASLEEPDLQASLTKRDTIIYRDNDFEVFLDPDGDTHDYFELEINALGTEWDLRMRKPYRDGGRADSGWDIASLQAAVSLDGTLNDPSDTDGGWSVEIAIPFSGLALETPRDGEQWRVNFSRVEWQFVDDDGVYRKAVDPETGRPLPESNWVWSPQYAVNMHMPELWGIVQFSTRRDTAPTVSSPDDRLARWSLRRVYYAQREYRREHGVWAKDLAALGLEGLVSGLRLIPALASPDSARSAWHALAPGPEGWTWHIRADGRTWMERSE